MPSPAHTKEMLPKNSEVTEKDEKRGRIRRLAGKLGSVVSKALTTRQGLPERLPLKTPADPPLENSRVILEDGTWYIDGEKTNIPAAVSLQGVVDYLPEYDAKKKAEALKLETAEAFVAAERSYPIEIVPAGANAELAPGEIAARMELDHVVKRAPWLDEQLRDPQRTDEFTYIKGSKLAIKAATSLPMFEARRVTIAENKALEESRGYMKQAADFMSRRGETDKAGKLTSMAENLTFIGKKECEEAAAGIADYWKALLEENPQLQILPRGHYRDVDDTTGSLVKSSTYLLDKVLGHFSEEELEKYKARLIAYPSEITATEPGNLRAVLLDDWSVSGQQAAETADEFAHYYPAFASSFEAQFIVASKKRIMYGVDREWRDGGNPVGERGQVPIIVRAYYEAHDETYEGSPGGGGTHTTGAHSSVDYGIEMVFDEVAEMVRRNGTDEEVARLGTLPPIANIVRPYRMEGYEAENVRSFYGRHRPVESDKRE